MSDAKINLLKNKRKLKKGDLTRFNTFLSKLIQASTDENKFTNSDKAQLETRMLNLQTAFNDFTHIQDEIDLELIELDEDDTILDVEFEERTLFENKFYESISEAQILINKHFEVPAVAKNHENNAVSPGNNSNVMEYQGVKFPEIRVPQFNGEFENFLSFRDLFTCLIHNNPRMTNLQKLHYLKTSLTGSAQEVLGNIDISSDNYQEAWITLCENFENKEILAQNYLEKILNINKIKQESALELRSMVRIIQNNLNSLKSLNLPTESWDFIIIHLSRAKLDPITMREWEGAYKCGDYPTLDEFTNFLKNKANMLQKMQPLTPIYTKNNEKIFATETKNAFNRKNPHGSRSFLSTSEECVNCKGAHKIYSCSDFLKLSSNQRYEKAKELKLCTNCLFRGHSNRDCNSKACKTCNRKHHTLLHYDKLKNVSVEEKVMENNVYNEPDTKKVLSSYTSIVQNQMLLSTAIVHVTDSKGFLQSCRMLLDSGSQSNFITSEFAAKLDVKQNSININVVGINQYKTTFKNKCEVIVTLLHEEYAFKLSCLVISNISNDIPNIKINHKLLEIPPHLNLADPQFYQPAKIDMLIGVEIFWQLISTGQISLGHNLPILQKTKLGWIISGPFYSSSTSMPSSICNFSQHNIQDQLKKFWQLEEVSSDSESCSNACGRDFVLNTKRDAMGRFIVSIPLNDNILKMGESKTQAIKRFNAIERKFATNTKLKLMYTEFMSEYEILNHMTKLTDPNSIKNIFYLPHHGVLRESSLTTKLRVVFDGSAVTSSGVSLNSAQLVGPIIQNDLFSILLRFRKHNIAISADITKMYRQVLINPEQRHLQCVLWREDPSLPMNTFQLNTVSYGTASASFLAIRCLHQLAIENKERHHRAAEVILNDFYVDDLLSGFHNVSSTKTLINQIISILAQGCFTLRKWVSNHPEILKMFQDKDNHLQTMPLSMGECCKTLGIHWDPAADQIQYVIPIINSVGTATKRTVLAAIAQIFDPLGLLGPVIVVGKILLQKIMAREIGLGPRNFGKK